MMRVKKSFNPSFWVGEVSTHFLEFPYRISIYWNAKKIRGVWEEIDEFLDERGYEIEEIGEYTRIFQITKDDFIELIVRLLKKFPGIKLYIHESEVWEYEKGKTVEEAINEIKEKETIVSCINIRELLEKILPEISIAP